MSPTWNIDEIAALSAEAKIRNEARQIHQEVAEWGRSLGYGGRPVRRNGKLCWDGSPRVSLLCGGYGRRSWVQVCIDNQPTTKRLLAVADPSALYAAIGAAEDAVSE